MFFLPMSREKFPNFLTPWRGGWIKIQLREREDGMLEMVGKCRAPLFGVVVFLLIEFKKLGNSQIPRNMVFV